MKKWLWIPIAGLLYLITPFLFESYASISAAPLQTNQVNFMEQCSMLFPLIFILEYRILYRVFPNESIASLVSFPLLTLLLSLLIGFLYLNLESGLLDNSFLMAVSISNLILFSIGAFFFYKKGK
jgi:hypothetical protein